MLHSCEDSQICTVLKIVKSDRNPRKGRNGKSDSNPTKGNLYYVPTRNPRMGRLEVNTLPKKDFYPVQIDEVGPPNTTMWTTGNPNLLDALVNKQTRHDLERLLEQNHHAFTEDEGQIGTTPLIKMSIDTSDHPPIAKKPYALASNFMTGPEMRLTNCLRQVSLGKATPFGQPQLWWYPKVMVARGYALISGP